ncbi:trichohyalin-like [Hemibagrus wyckioides]|uniref:trichohyalin-like n=1 Tax=Hemibagrus wyckioides TaxID=337641 RepID=UPI00266BA6DA|nr:trichohyalin-like [Hemibagrus wyckioides]
MWLELGSLTGLRAEEVLGLVLDDPLNLYFLKFAATADNKKCSGLLQWSLRDYRDVVLAECDRTSCRSKEGFNISHDQYLRGDSSLTITAADYSQRNVYACECEDSDFSYVRLIIETVFSQVQMESGEDLKLHVSVPEPVEVIYKSSGSADEVICRVNNLSLQCKDKYRDRTSLTYPELTLRHMEPRDSGSYTIRDTKNEEDIQIYAVSVEAVFSPVQMKFDEDLKLHVSVPEPVEVIYKSSGSADEVICRVNNLSLQCKDKYRDRTSLTYPELTLRHMEPRDSGSYTIRDTKNEEDIQIYAVSVEEPGFPAWGIVLIVLCLLSCCIGAGIYLMRSYRMRKQLKRRQQLVEQLVQQAEGGTEENIREAEKSLDLLKQQYFNTGYSAEVFVFCMEKRKQLLEWRMPQLDQLVQQAEEGTEEKIREVEESLNHLEQQYNNTEYSYKVKFYCSKNRKQLMDRRLQCVEQLVQQAEGGTEQNFREVEKEINQLEQQYINTENYENVELFCKEKKKQLQQYKKRGELNRQLLHVVQLVQQTKEEKKDTSNVEKELKQLKEHYKDTEHSDKVSLFCSDKISELNWYRLQHDKQPMTEKRRRMLNSRLLHVHKLIQQAKEGKKDSSYVENEIDQLEQQYWITAYSEQVTVLCEIKRKQLKANEPQHGNDECPVPMNEELYRQMKQLVQQVKGGTVKKISEVEEEINQLELQHMTSEDFSVVSWFCMVMRAELFWYRLLNSDKEQLMTEKIEILLKVEELMNSLQKLRDGAEREQEIPSFTVIYEMQKRLIEFKKWCEEKREQ